MTFWLALLAWLTLTVAGIAFAALRGLGLWRRAKRSGGAISAQIEEVAQKAEQVEAHLARAETSSAELRLALARLAESRARLEVQLRAVREARAEVEAALPLVGLLWR